MAEKYKFEFGQQVEFTIIVGWTAPKTRTMRGRVTGRYISTAGTAVYEVTLNTVKKAGRGVPVYRGIGERLMREAA